jgi:hypothetical protein
MILVGLNGITILSGVSPPLVFTFTFAPRRHPVSEQSPFTIDSHRCVARLGEGRINGFQRLRSKSAAPTTNNPMLTTALT